MLGNYFYHGIIRKTIIGFGTLFNNIEIRKVDTDGSIASVMKVPIAYGPIQKFLARINQQPDLNKKQTITLPRISFEMRGISYDPSRKGSVTQTFKSVTSDAKLQKVFLPVPYNINFQLAIMSKTQEDMLQIIEQILPFFQPAFNISIDLVETIGEKRDIPIVLESVNPPDDKYEGGYDETRTIIYTLNFVAKTSLFGLIADSTDKLIKKVQVDYYGNTATTAKREVRYTATPKALQDYNDDGVINAADDVLVEPGDDFGFNETSSFYQDFKTYSPSQQQDVDLT
jgi:hypothetical protein